jgi:hypothetical protein
VAESFDTSTPAGRLMLNVLLAFAEFELDRIKENWADALSNAIEVRGIQPTVPPFGYRKDDGKRFVVDPIEAPCVKEIFRRHIAGEKWASIARWLNAESIKPRQSEQWTGETVKQLTRREVYLGVVSKGDLRKDGAHEPLVNKTDFITCRDSFAKSGDAPSETRHVLNGIVRCAGCSRLMSGRGYKQAGQPRVAQYQCQVHHTAGDCPAPANVNETRILPYIETELFTHVGDVAAESQVESVELTQALEDEASAREVLTSYRDDVSLQDILGMQSFKEGLRIRQRALQSATEALAQARQTTSGIDLPPIETLTNVWPDLRPAERQRLFASAIDVIYVRRGAKRIEDRVKILWRGENVEPLSGPGRSVPLRTMSW